MIITDSDKSNSAQPSRHTSVDGAGTPRSSMTSAPGYYVPSPSLESYDIKQVPVPDDEVLPEYSPRVRLSMNDHRRAVVYSDMTWGDSSREPGSSLAPDRHGKKPQLHLPTYGLLSMTDAEAKFQDDGRMQISFDDQFSKQLPDGYGEPVQEFGIDHAGFMDAPRMSVNIMIVGSYDDVRPYLVLGKRLQQHGHTVRLATHETLRHLVKDAGLRFFSIGGSPHELMSYIVRSPGLISGYESARNGDITKKQKMVGEILERCFLSCFESDSEEEGGTPFAANAIISNPGSFPHIHCAEALGIPLVLSSSIPWCATTAFPHPLVDIGQGSVTEPKMANYFSYGLMDIITWQGLSHTINKFRMKRLGLPPLDTQSAVGMIERCSIPWTYCVSPTLVPKPQDWTSHIDVVGFYFSDSAKDYVPSKDLEAFLEAGDPPIYVGFGSVALDNPQQTTKSVLAAIAEAGVRAIVSPGWDGLDESMIKAAGTNVFALGDVPHDWLFERVSAVCHHGTAATTAIGLKCGKPAIIVPFFGDQNGMDLKPWWAAQVASCGTSPPPIHPHNLTADALTTAIRLALSPEMKEAAMRVGETINQEDGTKNGVESFYRHLPLLNMRCDLDPKRVAVWYSPVHRLRLSAFAAQVLVERGEIDASKLELHRPREYTTSDLLTGTVSPTLNILNDFGRETVGSPGSRSDKGAGKRKGAGTLDHQSALHSATKGIHGVPKYYGSDVRELGKVNGVGSGLVEGGKGFMFGLYDGFTDMVRQPAKGFMENGIVGAVAGVAIGSSNCVVKPVLGAMAALSLPMQGTVKDVRAWMRKQVDKERRTTRYREGLVATKEGTQEERDVVIKAFSERVTGSGVVDMRGKGKAA